MEKIIPKLKDIYENTTEFGGVMVLTNVDDIFCKIRSEGIDEVRVSWREMLDVARFTLANISNVKVDNLDWPDLKIITEGRVDKFFGVKLILEDGK